MTDEVLLSEAASKAVHAHSGLTLLFPPPGWGRGLRLWLLAGPAGF